MRNKYEMTNRNCQHFLSNPASIVTACILNLMVLTS
uniref:Uncharacterized protein n=1 Tax=Arundo donax TaxID=35708 RepID=A0A0A8YVT8_ARUDO